MCTKFAAIRSSIPPDEIHANTTPDPIIYK